MRRRRLLRRSLQSDQTGIVGWILLAVPLALLTRGAIIWFLFGVLWAALGAVVVVGIVIGWLIRHDE